MEDGFGPPWTSAVCCLNSAQKRKILNWYLKEKNTEKQKAQWLNMKQHHMQMQPYYELSAWWALLFPFETNINNCLTIFPFFNCYWLSHYSWNFYFVRFIITLDILSLQVCFNGDFHCYPYDINNRCGKIGHCKHQFWKRFDCSHHL